jgi:hypothetical protein
MDARLSYPTVRKLFGELATVESWLFLDDQPLLLFVGERELLDRSGFGSLSICRIDNAERLRPALEKQRAPGAHLGVFIRSLHRPVPSRQ